MKIREHLITLEYLNRSGFKKNELKNNILRSIRKSQDNNKGNTLYLNKKLLKQNKKQLLTRLKNRCHMTGKLNSYIKFCGLSRHMTKRLAGQGELQNLNMKSF